MLLSRRALPARIPKSWRPGINPQRRWFTSRHCRTVVMDVKHQSDPFILQSFSSFTRIELVSEPLIVMVSTPSFASKFSSPSGPTPLFRSALDKVFEQSLKRPPGPSISSIRVLFAVVDALPAPVPGRICEGISYAVLVPDSADQNLLIVPDEADRDELGTLEFQFTDHWCQRVQSNALIPLGSTDYRVAIKLANTLFQSGRKKTMLDAEYAVDPDGGLRLSRHEWLSQCAIPYHSGERKFIDHFPQRPSATDKLLKLSLIPLTEPRKISVSLGNILRTVELPDGSQRPASHELEANLDSFFQATGQEPHPRQVWAFLTNEAGVKRFDLVLQNAKFLDSLNYAQGERSGLQAMWEKPDTEASADCDIALRESILLDGAKLQRVLSGGGGWGDKAGLLALDPQDSLMAQTPEEREISQFSSGNSEYTHVQFFTSTNSPPAHLFRYRQGFFMGVLPEGTPSWVPLKPGRERQVYKMTFAAFSSESMSFRTNTSTGANFPVQDAHPLESTRTKIDAPFSSFTYATLDEHHDSALNRNKIRASELLEIGQWEVSKGRRFLGGVADDTWKVIRDTSMKLRREAGVPLWIRRKEIRRLCDSLVRIVEAANPQYALYLVNGVKRLNAMADTGEMRYQRKTLQRKTLDQLNKDLSSSGRDFFIHAVIVINLAIRRSLDFDKREGVSVFAQQRLIRAIAADLLRITEAEAPKDLDNQRVSFEKTLSVTVSLAYCRLYQSHQRMHTFIKRTRVEIDDSKRALGVPVTHYTGTAGAGAEIVAEELKAMLANGGGGLGQNLSDMKHMKQASAKKEGEEATAVEEESTTNDDENSSSPLRGIDRLGARRE